ncbi:DNA/RNA non-specific endonuclease [Pedobacter sp. MR2016-19]|uniref:DNA/RNA non-specific endonuclease n=1 Tax=Pedobacter sp. MR2016-19 TaxID=2780089 RepID=UPI00187706FD|nr:DNA/RNA non-specific endonuclease [Pedobacter sp. MR2016-19]MBE5321894.1 DNA/RNA non-specific endonuclease [Pedobacter sp. MR2016-19]
MKALKKLSLLAILCLGLAACKKENQTEPGASVFEQKLNTKAAVASEQAVVSGFPESFESGTKSSYSTASVTLSSGSWTMNDALIGNQAADAKNGSQSVRIRNTGILGMNFDVSGADVVTIAHAKYGTDGNSTWQLWYSTNGGSSWQQTGSTITSSAASLSTVTFNTAISGNVRFQVRKISGGTNRINIDDFSISTGGGTTTPPTTTPGDNNNLLMGNPSNAVANISYPENYLMERSYYTSSYSKSRATPNWVSWHISSSDLGSTSRQDDFRADNTLPSGWYQVSNSSYSGSGFDRGHNCPSADRTASVAANSSTFLMSNMMPQAPNNNQGPWADLENYARSLVTSGNEVYIICGSYGSGGTGSNGGITYTIDNGRVNVPSNTWKVIVVLANGNDDLNRITSSTRVISVNMPNTNGLNTNWKTYRTSVDAIESATGYDLLSNIPTAIQNALESRTDNL